MSAKRSFPARTWVEIEAAAVRANIRTFRKLIGPKVKLWSVVKSNAYGHGLYAFAPLAAKLGVDGFCVDSLIEAVRLRETGITQPILVLGSTLPELFGTAAALGVTLSLSTPEDIKALRRAKLRPEFHIKVDTGMHRRGFMEKEFAAAVKTLKTPELARHCAGIYTHFAAAKDLTHPDFVEKQFERFEKMEKALRRFAPKMMAHAAATGGTLVNKRYHRDVVRIGIGLYGYHPSSELEAQLPRVKLRPALTWNTIIAELKTVPAGESVGYNFTERLRRTTRLAILPIGYWHGFPVALSGVGEVLIKGRRARVVGRVSMDLVAVDVTGIPCKVGDTVTLIGRNGKDSISAWEFASRMPSTHHYEILTRLNPLMERKIV
jgi:alanine racemase